MSQRCADWEERCWKQATDAEQKYRRTLTSRKPTEDEQDEEAFRKLKKEKRPKDETHFCPPHPRPPAFGRLRRETA